jgi:cyclophilin family peptidyl-prolyl cis-trans isomerase
MKKLFPILWALCLAFVFQATALAQIITNQPQSITVNNASTARFTAGASNATSYQWQFNTTNLSNGTMSDGVIISGSATSALTLEDVTSNEAGSYTVVVNGMNTSSNAVLTIVPGTIVTFIFTNFPGGGTSNVDVQLFNHDKPVTVQNFIQYITAGAYTNMFFDRCITNFVLQGGDYGASNQTMSTSPITGWFINQQFTEDDTIEPPFFPDQITNEFNVGPLINNDFGTIAMALAPNEPNSATSAFFFNLADNATGANNLDTTNNGPFTVFGRIISGTNVLQYFNTLTNGGGMVTNGQIVFDGGGMTNPLANLPVNYIGTYAPADSNLIYCSFQLASPPGATNLPTVSITSPAADAVLNDSFSLTIQGAAIDTNDIGLAWVRCDLIPLPATNGTLPNGGVSLTNYVLGSTNWSLNFGTVAPGMYELGAQAQDEATNLSHEVFVQPLIITAIVTNGNGTATFTQGSFANLNAVGYPFQQGSNYEVVATAGSNELFVSWSNENAANDNSETPYTLTYGVLTATFISNGIPNSITFTYPAPNAIITTNAFNITGTISTNIASPPVTVTCTIFSQSSGFSVTPPMTNGGTTNWSVAVTNGLPTGSYTIQAIAVDSASNSTMITNNFTLATNASLDLDIVGLGTVSGATNGESFPVGSIFTVAAITNSGQLFYTWSNNLTGEVSMNPVQTNTMAPGLTLTATFVSNTLPPYCITFTSPSANVVLSNGDVQVGGTISNVPLPPLTVTCQIFSQTNMLAVSAAMTTSATTNWSFIMSVPGAGSYIALVEAVDRAGDSTVTNEDFNATVDTNQPAISILHPVTNSTLTVNYDLTASGTASDSVGLALVSCYLVPTNAADGTIPNGGNYFLDNALGTTNWSLDFGIVPPGVYILYAYALDDAGNYGQQIQTVTNTAILINGNGSVSLTQGGVVKPNPVGYPLQYGTAYTVEATPGAGQTFVGWSEGAYTTTNPVVTFTNSPGLLWTATFVPGNTGKGIAFTYPTANARLTTNTFLLKGRMTSSYKSARISCQISSLTTGFGVGPLLATSGATTWSAGVSNLPPDNYIVEAVATNAAGQSTIISERFSILAFADVVGTYSGLFICTNSPVAPTNSGFLTFTVTPSGTFSGKLVFPAYGAIPIYSLSFENIYFTTGYYSITTSENVPVKPLSMAIYLDLSGGTDVALGTISSEAWSSQLICHRAVTKLSTHTTPATGKYILSLQPGNQTNKPDTNGYAALVIASDGTMALSGALPDDTTFSQSAGVSTNGVWPLYVIPAGYKTNGMLMGWETNQASGGSSGQLYWYKASDIGAYYTNGVGIVSNMPVNSTGTNYARPATGSQYSIIFQGGTIVPPLTNSLMVNEAGQFVVSNSPPDKLKISLSANGVIAGSILNSNDNKTLRFKGAFISPSQGGSGFIPDAGGQTGCFELELEPR